MADAKSFDLKGSMAKLETTLEEYLVKKAPALPENIKELIVRFAPWITVILLVLTLLVILAVLGLGALILPFSVIGGAGYGLTYILSLVLTVVTLVLEVMAIPGLFKKKASAWRLLYYATLITAVQNLISFNLGGLIIGTLLGLYILFQIKSYYK